jgi:hypothetical protein
VHGQLFKPVANDRAKTPPEFLALCDRFNEFRLRIESCVPWDRLWKTW